jgi:hypothetical protein
MYACVLGVITSTWICLKRPITIIYRAAHISASFRQKIGDDNTDLYK